jgi:hypothetical protein
MTQYQWIKSKLKVKEELFALWENYPLYKFISGAQWVRKRELDIAECLIDREQYIEQCRMVWHVEELDKILKKGKKQKG